MTNEEIAKMFEKIDTKIENVANEIKDCRSDILENKMSMSNELNGYASRIDKTIYENELKNVKEMARIDKKVSNNFTRLMITWGIGGTVIIGIIKYALMKI